MRILILSIANVMIFMPIGMLFGKVFGWWGVLLGAAMVIGIVTISIME